MKTFALHRNLTCPSLRARSVSALLILLWALPSLAYVHSVKLVNNTGKTANDLHIEFNNRTFDAKCDPMTNGAATEGSRTYDFDKGSVAPSGKATIAWSTAYVSDGIVGGYWTSNGVNIGNIGTIPVSLYYFINPNGSAVAVAYNPGSAPINYSNLFVFTGVDQKFFAPQTFVDHMTSGQFVETFAPANGTLQPGPTALTWFHPSLTGYTAFSLDINGSSFALGSSPFPTLTPPIQFGDQVMVQASGESGRNYILEGSPDLMNWNPFQTGIVSDVSATYVDQVHGGNYFYRALLSSPSNGPAIEQPCPGGVWQGGYTVSECITGFWHVVYYDNYACPPDWQSRTYRVKQVKTDQPCSSVLNESLITGAASATAVRNSFLGPDGLTFYTPSSGIDYSSTLFPPQGTIDLDLSVYGAAGSILDTRGIGTRVQGDAIITVNGLGKAFFAIDPIGGQNPASLPGVTTTSTINDGLFHTLSVSYGSAGLKIYVDGNLENSNPELSVPLVRSTITFGDYLDSIPQSFQGTIRHIRTSATQGDVQQPRNAVQGPFVFTNTTPAPVNDFHAVFRGTGGTLNGPKMTAGPANAIITASGNEVDITFPTPVQPGASIGFTVNSRLVPITVDHAWWTLDGDPVAPAKQQ